MKSLHYSQIQLILLSGFFLATSIAQASHLEKSENPNFVVFLTDDQGWGDLGCYGHPLIQSPHLDRFAKEGLRLTQCYSACSVCSPSRSSILTGRTPYRNGVWRWLPTNSPYHLRESEITIAEILKQKGYETCHVGKWHLNGRFNSTKQPQPDNHGYDHWMATQNNAVPNHLNPKNFVRNGKPVGQLNGPSSLICVEEAIQWLRSRKDKSRPFFLTVWTHEPHLPIESAPKFMEPYAAISDEGIRQHHGNITQLDQAFGNLMNALEQMKYTESTCVFYTSDNGPEGKGTQGRTRGSTGGLRGRKRHTHEGGIRVPGMVRWPGKIKPETTSDTPVIGSDIFPTICQIVGEALPSDRVIDGASILPIFAGEPIQRKEPLYWRNHLAPKNSRVAIRIGDWKILGSDDLTQFELYNIQEDWQEQKELSTAYPEKFEELKRKLISYDQSVLADGPQWWKNEKPKTKIPKNTQKKKTPLP
ncbi:MAG: sulfatase-like hydrolase/transferase [Planctomycetota bacterium]|nr:sulfatase-like hydrolase/transferase [Planctomycetota bacterium]